METVFDQPRSPESILAGLSTNGSRQRVHARHSIRTQRRVHEDWHTFRRRVRRDDESTTLRRTNQCSKLFSELRGFCGVPDQKKKNSKQARRPYMQPRSSSILLRLLEDEDLTMLIGQHLCTRSIIGLPIVCSALRPLPETKAWCRLLGRVLAPTPAELCATLQRAAVEMARKDQWDEIEKVNRHLRGRTGAPRNAKPNVNF